MLSIIDNFGQLSPALDVRVNYRGAEVVQTLERVAATHGRPKRIRLDNGPQFISKDIDLWALSYGVVLDFSRPGKPIDNAFVEFSNGRVRAECFNAFWFLRLDDARVKCEAWRFDYNEVRPYSSPWQSNPDAKRTAFPYSSRTRDRGRRNRSPDCHSRWSTQLVQISSASVTSRIEIGILNFKKM